MKETTAYAIVKKLKAAGHNVSIKDAPPAFPTVPDHKPPVDYDDLAVVGPAGMSKADVEACVTVCRREVHKTMDGYAIDTTGKCRQFPDASFAVW